MSQQGAIRTAGARGWPALGVALLCVLLLSATAFAQTAARVALVTTDPDASSTRRLKAELLELGVEVEVIAPEPGEPIGRATLERIARQAGAFAAIRVVPIAAEVEVWVADRVTGKTVVREIIRGNSEHASVDDAIAVGAVELLRASLLEVSTTTKLHGDVPPPAEVKRMLPPPAPAPPSKPERPASDAANERVPVQVSRRAVKAPTPSPAVAPGPSVALAIEPVLELGLGGLPLAVQGQVSLRTRIHGDLSAEFMALFPVSPAEMKQQEGTAEISTRWFALSAAWVPVFEFVEPLVGVGLAAVRAEAWGMARAPFVSQRQHLWVLAPMLRTGLAFAVSSTVRFRADASTAFALKSVPVRFGEREIAKWGRPALVVGAGVEVELPLLVR